MFHLLRNLVTLRYTWLHLVALGCICFYSVALGCTWLHFFELGCTWMHLVALGCIWMHLVALGCTWLHLVALGCTCLHFFALGCTALIIWRSWDLDTNRHAKCWDFFGSMFGGGMDPESQDPNILHVWIWRFKLWNPRHKSQHTGDTDSLKQCGWKHQYQKVPLKCCWSTIEVPLKCRWNAIEFLFKCLWSESVKIAQQKEIFSDVLISYRI